MKNFFTLIQRLRFILYINSYGCNEMERRFIDTEFFEVLTLNYFLFRGESTGDRPDIFYENISWNINRREQSLRLIASYVYHTVI